MDEARHFEALTSLYRRLAYHPVTVREMPEMLRYHNRLRRGDRVDWVWGILISDIFAKNFYQMFAKAQPEALFGKLSARILIDESRHQAFAQYYLKRAIPQLDANRLAVLRSMRDELLQIMDSMYGRLKDDADAIGLDGRSFLDHLREEINQKAQGIGLEDADHSDNEPPLGRPERVRRLVRGVGDALNAAGDSLGETMKALKPRHDCQGCFLSLLCESRLVRAATALP
jgi:hypothetical protein